MSARAALRWVPSDAVTVDLVGDWTDDDSNAGAQSLIAVNTDASDLDNFQYSPFGGFNGNVAIPIYGIPYDERFLTGSQFSTFASVQNLVHVGPGASFPSAAVTGITSSPNSSALEAYGFAATVDMEHHACFAAHVHHRLPRLHRRVLRRRRRLAAQPDIPAERPRSSPVQRRASTARHFVFRTPRLDDRTLLFRCLQPQPRAGDPFSVELASFPISTSRRTTPRTQRTSGVRRRHMAPHRSTERHRRDSAYPGRQGLHVSPPQLRPGVPSSRAADAHRCELQPQ